ncbi:MAG: hypothetical protein GYB67_04670 [Chloroflexi bacterium]|nr:hypothetical protein [Chloroflexota bacterium]
MASITRIKTGLIVLGLLLNGLGLSGTLDSGVPLVLGFVLLFGANEIVDTFVLALRYRKPEPLPLLPANNPAPTAQAVDALLTLGFTPLEPLKEVPVAPADASTETTVEPSSLYLAADQQAIAAVSGSNTALFSWNAAGDLLESHYPQKLSRQRSTFEARWPGDTTLAAVYRTHQAQQPQLNPLTITAAADFARWSEAHGVKHQRGWWRPRLIIIGGQALAEMSLGALTGWVGFDIDVVRGNLWFPAIIVFSLLAIAAAGSRYGLFRRTPYRYQANVF